MFNALAHDMFNALAHDMFNALAHDVEILLRACVLFALHSLSHLSFNSRDVASRTFAQYKSRRREM